MHHLHFQFRTEDEFSNEQYWRSQEPNGVKGRTGKTEVVEVIIVVIIIIIIIIIIDNILLKKLHNKLLTRIKRLKEHFSNCYYHC